MNRLSLNINKKKHLIVLIFVLLTFILSACGLTSENAGNSNKMRVHFLDVGQADSELIELPNGEVMLIDGGNRGDSEFLVDYIKNLNIEKLDYVIVTHPHEDHIGGLSAIIKQFDIGQIYMPNKTANTRIFETLINEIKAKELKITEAKSGINIVDDRNLSVSIIAPNRSGYEKINDYSIANKLIYKDISLIFTGDAERQSEYEMISSGVNLSADILKIGHHGSNTSSSEEFLDKVNPDYAIISCEQGNNYGHPHSEIIKRLKKRDIKILRTDQMGTIILETDGKSANLISEK